MRITVARAEMWPTSIIGSLSTDHGFFCYTLERRPDAAEHPCVPAGTYGLVLAPTHNAKLWTPDPDRVLPRLLDVPGRTGILMHAGNWPTDTVGCIIVAFVKDQGAVFQSQSALRTLLRAIQGAQGPHSVEILDIPADPSQGTPG